MAAALGDKAGIARYGSATLPMDEARATCAIDLSGRPYFVWEVPMPKAKLGTWDTELAEIFFEAFARGCACNLHVVLHAGTNLHHMTEICFKAFAKALRAAATLDPRAVGHPVDEGLALDASWSAPLLLRRGDDDVRIRQHVGHAHHAHVEAERRQHLAPLAVMTVRERLVPADHHAVHELA